MKKLILTGIIAAFAIGCSPTNMESDYETEIQIIDKENYQNPATKDIKKDKDE